MGNQRPASRCYDGRVAGTFLDRIGAFALSIEGAREEFSFGPDDPVYKAANGKIFAIAGETPEGARVSVKLSPEEVIEALTLSFVRSAPYLSKTHWVMAVVASEPELDMTLGWILRSHELVIAKQARRKPPTGT